MGTGGDIVEDELLGGPSAQQGRNAVVEFGFPHQKAFFRRDLHGVAQGGNAPRYDGYLLDRIGPGQGHGHDGMTQLVVGHDFLFGGIDQAVFFLQSGHHALDGFFNLRHSETLFVAPDRQKGGFVDKIGQIRTDHAGGHAGDFFSIDNAFGFHLVEVDFQDVGPAAFVRSVDKHLAVEAPRPQQGGVQNLRPIGRGHQNDTDIRVEAIELDQQLVQGLFSFIVTAGHADAPGLAQCIQFVDEYDARRFFFGFLEKVSHARGAQADKHFNELGSAQAEKGYAAFSRHGFRQQCFTGAGRTDQQDAAGNLSPDTGVASRLLEEGGHLFKLLPGFVHAGGILEADRDIILHVDLGLVFANGHKSGLLLEPAHHEHPDAEEQGDRYHPGHDGAQEIRFDSAGIGDIVLFQQLGNAWIHAHCSKQRAFFGTAVGGDHAALDIVFRNGDFGHLALFHQLDKLAVGYVFHHQGRGDHVMEQQDQPYPQEHIPQGKFVLFFHGSSFQFLFNMIPIQRCAMTITVNGCGVAPATRDPSIPGMSRVPVADRMRRDRPGFASLPRYRAGLAVFRNPMPWL